MAEEIISSDQSPGKLCAGLEYLCVCCIRTCLYVGFLVSRLKCLTIPANSAQAPIINRILKTADPTMVPTPTSLLDMNTPEK